MFDGKQFKSFKFTDAESTNDTETKKANKTTVYNSFKCWTDFLFGNWKTQN